MLIWLVKIGKMLQWSATVKETKGIYRRGQIYWFATQKNGVRHQVSLQTEDLPEAIRRARDMKTSPAFAPKFGVAAEKQAFLKEKERLNQFTRATKRVHGAALDEFCLRCGTINLSEVKLKHIEDHFHTLQKRVAEATAQIHIRAIKAFFSWCVKENKLHKSPCAGLKLTKIDQPARLRFCTAQQRDVLINDAPSEDLRFILYAGFGASTVDPRSALSNANRPESGHFSRGVDTTLLQASCHTKRPPLVLGDCSARNVFEEADDFFHLGLVEYAANSERVHVRVGGGVEQSWIHRTMPGQVVDD